MSEVNRNSTSIPHSSVTTRHEHLDHGHALNSAPQNTSAASDRNTEDFGDLDQLVFRSHNAAKGLTPSKTPRIDKLKADASDGGGSGYELSEVQLEHQLRLDSDADRLSRLMRGPTQKNRSDRIQRKIFRRIVSDTFSDEPDTVREPTWWEGGVPHGNKDENFEGPTATLFRLQIKSSSGADELLRTMRVATDIGGEDPARNDHKRAKVARLLKQAWVIKAMQLQFLGKPDPRKESTLLSDLLRKTHLTRKDNTQQDSARPLLWAATYGAASAHTLEAVKTHLEKLGLIIDANVVRFEVMKRFEVTNNTLAGLMRNLKVGFTGASAFKGTRNVPGLLSILDGIFTNLVANRLKAGKAVSALRDWRILYPWIWMLTECSAGERIQAIHNVLISDSIMESKNALARSLTTFFTHMLLRAGDATRAWTLYTTLLRPITSKNPQGSTRASRISTTAKSQSLLDCAMLAHASSNPTPHDPVVSRTLERTLYEVSASQLQRMEEDIGILWFTPPPPSRLSGQNTPQLEQQCGFHRLTSLEHFERQTQLGSRPRGFDSHWGLHRQESVGGPESAHPASDGQSLTSIAQDDHDHHQTNTPRPDSINRIFHGSRLWPSGDEELEKLWSDGWALNRERTRSRAGWSVEYADFNSWRDLPTLLANATSEGSNREGRRNTGGATRARGEDRNEDKIERGKEREPRRPVLI